MKQGPYESVMQNPVNSIASHSEGILNMDVGIIPLTV